MDKTKNIFQSVTFPASPEKLYNFYLSPKEHGKVTGMKVVIGKKVGARFKAFGGALSGKILHLVSNKLIVQIWRSTKFYKSNLDSILILKFVKVKGGTQIQLSHLHVPPHDYNGINKGWPKFYWKPLMAYLKRGKNG